MNWERKFFVDVSGVRARLPSLIIRLLSDLERFEIDRELLSVAAFDRSFGVVGENSVDTVAVLFANESPIELCRLRVPKF